jgi:phosphoribosyl-ATP pyrophosphohydrolase/phosphoribosyl-AMP cyclohydrolase
MTVMLAAHRHTARAIRIVPALTSPLLLPLPPPLLLLLLQGVPMEDVMRVLRKRFGTSGIDEKAARPPKR